MIAYDRGVEDYIDGIESYDNPYIDRTLRHLWLVGWCAGHAIWEAIGASGGEQ